MKKLALVILLLAVVAAGVTYKLYGDVVRFRDAPFGTAGAKTVEIPAGATARQVVRLLAKANVFADETLGWRYVRYLKRDRRPLKAGEYEFAGALKPDDVLEKLYRGEVKTYRFTVPEGLRMEEIAGIVGASGLARAGDVLKLMRDPAVAAALDVPFKNLEGYLYPDTYTFPRNPRPLAIVKTMVERFRQAYKKADAQRLAGVELDEAQAATLGSIIEKETGRPEERPHISCVFHNRLKRGIPLATDPTVMYATMLRTGHWSKNITKADLSAPSPYNTYLVKGLPPGPIASAGEAALAAALHPIACNDLYFVSRNDGTHVFCPDYKCHEAAVEKWQVEFFRKQRGAAAAAPRHAVAAFSKKGKKKR